MARKRDFLSFWDLHDGEIEALIRRAEEFRFLRQVRAPHATRPGRVLGMIFEKASTRTRASFEIAIYELGGHGVVLGRGDSQLGRGEPIRDTARVLSGYCHAVMVRTFGHDRAEELARYASVPVINGLTDLLHPCQVLADLQTVYAHFSGGGEGGAVGGAVGGALGGDVGGPPGGGPGDSDASDVAGVLREAKYAWVGDGNNMASSWIEAAGILGLDLALACPEGHDPDPNVLGRARRTERGRIAIVRDARQAVAGRHVVSTDVFASMGQEAEADERRRAFAGYQVDAAVMSVADASAVVLHCLPAHRGEEIADDVIEGPQSLVWKQAENRLHSQKALLEWAMA